MHRKAVRLALILLASLLVMDLRPVDHQVTALDFRPERVEVKRVDYLGQVSIPVGLLAKETEVGGLSALTYDALADRYYVLSDDRSDRNPARFYTVTIDVGDGALTNGDIVFTGVTTLLGDDGQPFPADGLDPEGIALSPQGTLFISSEGVPGATPPVAPFVNEFEYNGRQIRELTLPEKFLPNAGGTRGVRNNLAFESLTFVPDARYLLTAVENALVQDGPKASDSQTSPSRILKLDRTTGDAVAEFVYLTGPSAAPVPPTIPHGLVEMVSLDNNGSLLTLERGPSAETGLAVRLYQTRLQGALDVGAIDSLIWGSGGVPYQIGAPAVKELLLDFADLGLPFINNFEGMTLGPVLPDGRQTLILVSDNNFSIVPTQFIALGLTLGTVPAAIPSLETPLTHDDAAAAVGITAGDSGDSAIWLHPTDPQQSVVAVTLKDGGLMTLDLEGHVIQRIAPVVYGDSRYTGVDVVYNFPLGPETADLFVVSDRRNDMLAIFKINRLTQQLTDVTSPDMPASLFGADDGDRTAFGLATYANPITGATYAFVTQAGGNLVAQVELTADAAGLVTGAVVRTLTLPAPTGDAAGSQAEGLAVDRLLGRLYVAMETNVGIIAFSADPNGGDDYVVIHAIDGSALRQPIKGLTIYYGAGQSGYLLASSQGDQSYAVFERGEGNAYLGSFIVADEGKIDQANATEGIDVINIPLGPAFPNGLLVVQDGVNDPQNTVANEDRLVNSSTNFKFVRWDSVAEAFPEGLLMDRGSYNPRYPLRALLPLISSN